MTYFATGIVHSIVGEGEQTEVIWKDEPPETVAVAM